MASSNRSRAVLAWRPLARALDEAPESRRRAIAPPHSRLSVGTRRTLARSDVNPHMSIQGGGSGLSRGFLEAIHCLYPNQRAGMPPTGSIATTMMARCGPVSSPRRWVVRRRRSGRLGCDPPQRRCPVGAGWYRDRSARDRRAVRVRSRHYLTAPGERSLLT